MHLSNDQYRTLARQLCNLVANRRHQVGKEPLRDAHIMRAVRYIIGPRRPEAYPYHTGSSWMWDCPIPYSLTPLAEHYFAAKKL